jgi:hypothetical protein
VFPTKTELFTLPILKLRKKVQFTRNSIILPAVGQELRCLVGFLTSTNQNGQSILLFILIQSIICAYVSMGQLSLSNWSKIYIIAMPGD